MKSYESVIIVNSSLSEETLNKIVKRSEDFISKNGGKLGETIQWGKRRLAYPIKKFQYGYYFIFKFDASPEIISEFEREFRLDENILRFMTFLKTQKEVLAEQKLRELEAKVAEKAKATIENADDLEDEKTGAKQKPGSDKEPADEAVDSTETPEEKVPAEDVKKETEEPAVETEPVEKIETASDVETSPAEDVKDETEEPVEKTEAASEVEKTEPEPKEEEPDKPTETEDKEPG